MASALTAVATVGCSTQCTRSRNGWTEIAGVCGIAAEGGLTVVGAANKLPLDAEPNRRERGRGVARPAALKS